jgi:hypothetical protein
MTAPLTRETVELWAGMGPRPTLAETLALARSWLEKDEEEGRQRYSADFSTDMHAEAVGAARKAGAQRASLLRLLEEIADHDTYHKNTCYLLANAGRADECDCGGVQLERKITEALASKDKERPHET